MITLLEHGYLDYRHTFDFTKKRKLACDIISWEVEGDNLHTFLYKKAKLWYDIRWKYVPNLITQYN